MSLAPNSWPRIKELFDEATDLPSPARARLLAGEPETVRREVESLLAADARTANFIEKPVASIPEEFLSDREDSLIGKQLGAYRIVRELGRGGLGVVYLAARADDQFQKQVAIKLIKRGLDTDEIQRRFRNERQILATLEHPNIARLLDAGATEEGLSYLVMEYVEGEPILAYCDRMQASLEERLRLFQTVCGAVSYAHRHLVIHRDLKPSNVLITREGEPKLLDFGIAKLLGENEADLSLTMPGQRMLTPEYASPEQVRGEAMTTASDTYSLGVVLYELLTGAKPYRLTTDSAKKMAQAITDQEPARPSTVVASASSRWFTGWKPMPQLRGDLDNIVLMAMRKEPARRYSSTAQFSEDIRRHLKGLPVVARKDTWSYRSSKFSARNKIGVAAAVLLFLTLAAGIVVSGLEARRARIERARAENRFNDVRALANSLLFEIHDAIEKLPGSTRARALLVRRALEYLDSLAREGAGDTSLQRELAAAYMKVGNVQGNPTNANLGDSTGALQSYAKSLAITDTLLSQSNEPEDKRALAMTLRKVADVEANYNRTAQAVRTARRSLAIFKELAEASPKETEARMMLAIGQLKLGDILGNPNFVNLSDRDGAMENYNSALIVLAALHASNPSEAKARRYLGIIHERIGAMHETEGEPRAALNEYRNSAAIRVPLAKEFPDDASIVRDSAIAYEKLGNAAVASGDLSGALTNRRDSLEIFRQLVNADPPNIQAQLSLAISYDHLAELLGGPASPNLDQPTEALAQYQQALSLLQSIEHTDPENTASRQTAEEVQAKIATLRARIQKAASSAPAR